MPYFPLSTVLGHGRIRLKKGLSTYNPYQRLPSQSNSRDNDNSNAPQRSVKSFTDRGEAFAWWSAMFGVLDRKESGEIEEIAEILKAIASNEHEGSC
ncbi:hypothetical protein J6590_022415 [Homalodisca vitripennis]|nr:hypothetical protein J6590_022415 [Homalodisca vitripennis]